jgi:hypothetical protein
MKYAMIWAMVMVSGLVYGQKYTVKGVVQDSDKNSLIGAVVVLLEPKDSTMVEYSVTDNTGSFSIANLVAGKYVMQLTYIGYGTLQRNLEVSGENRVMDLGSITMLQEGKMLETVTISAEYVPIKVTKDTLEFNADAFKTQPNAIVEDLLKKLPGVEVDADGGIKVQGEEVKAVTVDGKEFFGKDPKMATRNLPADAIKKVQIFDKKSKSAEFTGIDDGQEEKTINLELKEEKRRGYFGNVMGGYGTDSRYEGKAMVNRFSKKNQVSMIGSLNNLNNSGINVNDYMSMTGGSQGGGFRNINLSGNSGVPLSFGQNNNGLTNSITAGFNLNQDFGKRSRFSASYYLAQSETDLRQQVLTNSFLPSGALISGKNFNSLSDGVNHNVNANVELRIDSTTELTLTGSLGLRDAESNANQLDSTFNAGRQLLNLNDQLKTNQTNSDNWSLSGNFRKKLSKTGRTLTLDGSLSQNNSDNIYRILSEVYGRDFLLNEAASVFQDQNQYSNNNNYSFGMNYTEPLGNQFYLAMNASRRNNSSDLIKDFLDLNPDNLGVPGVLNETLSRTFDNRFVYNLGGVNLRINKENFTASAGVEYQNSNLNGIPNVGVPIDRSFNYFLPKASIDLDKLRIRVNYSTSVREPSMEQLQPVVDNSDPLNVYQGNPNLVPEYRHNMRISYNFFDQFNFRSLFANLRLGYTKNRITTSSFIDPELFIRTQTPLNTDFETTASGNINYSSPLNFMKAKFRTGINSSYTSGINFINQVENRIDRVSNGFNLLVENKTKTRFDASVSGRWNFTNNIYRENEALNTGFLNQTYEGFFALFAGKGWTIDTRMEYFIYGQGSFDESTSVKLWQASVSKAFLNNKLTAKLRVFDLLNQNQGVSRSASETNISESLSNTIGRYFMLNITYNLQSMGAGNQPQGANQVIIQRN